MVEKVPYTIVKKIGAVEIRRYPEILFAVTENDAYDSGFNLLFRYITGENKTRRRIPMTAPVVTSENIAMTAPVVTRGKYMAFSIPASYTKDTVPTPTNPAVHIEIQTERTLAVLRFSGRTNERTVSKNTQMLLAALLDHNIRTKGDPVLMRYNSPFTPGFLRRNEIGVEITES